MKTPFLLLSILLLASCGKTKLTYTEAGRTSVDTAYFIQGFKPQGFDSNDNAYLVERYTWIYAGTKQIAKDKGTHSELQRNKPDESDSFLVSYKQVVVQTIEK